MRSILLCVATKKGYEVLKAINRAFPEVCLHVCTFSEKGVVESFSTKIKEFARENGCNLQTWKEIKSAGAEWFQRHQIGGILLIGWIYLLPEGAINSVSGRVIVAHDSLLPKYRGFIPLASALLNGENKTGVTFLHAAKDVDAGDIVVQLETPIAENDTIAALTDKVVPLYVEGALKTVRMISAGDVPATPQRHADATYSIWRDEVDYFIDWRDSAQLVERQIRASGPPYEGARCRMGDKTVILDEAHVEVDLPFEIRQPGKIWRLTAVGEPVVVCGTGLLRISRARIGGESLVPMNRLRVRFT